MDVICLSPCHLNLDATVICPSDAVEYETNARIDAVAFTTKREKTVACDWTRSNMVASSWLCGQFKLIYTFIIIIIMSILSEAAVVVPTCDSIIVFLVGVTHCVPFSPTQLAQWPNLHAFFEHTTLRRRPDMV